LQIELLELIEDQAEAYNEAIEEYRAAAHTAQATRAVSKELTNAVDS
jgi:hypothetical protein